jgi:thiol:disulfide interchange protein DsbD
MVAALAVAIFSVGAHAEPVRTGHVEAELHSARAAIAPGERFTVVLRQTIDEHWHSYWLNPGDAGEPTVIDWTLPAGAAAGDIQWPTPHAIPFADLVNYGYSDEVLLPVEITAPTSLRPGDRLALNADATWVVCENECVFEEAVLALSLPVEAVGRDDPQWAPRIAAALAALPLRGANIEAHITAGAPAVLSVALGDVEIRNARFFPFSRDAVRPSAPQNPRVGPNGVSFRLVPGVDDNLGEVPLAGLVAFEERENGLWVRRAYEIAAQPGAPVEGADAAPAAFSDDYPLATLDGGASAAPAASNLGVLALIAVLGFALVGGLILNIMPCVLPVLSIKALAFAGGVQTGEARRHGVLYFAGVMATFLALALALIALRGAGAAIGWGFQLQEPWVTSGLALLFFAIALNLLGVFEVGGSLQNAGAGLAARGGDAGAFFTGALAVVAATPCTAPFMAGAIGVALAQPTPTTLLIFSALAIGFAAPLTLLHFLPGLQRLIPKPGPWMERAKNVLAFPMFAAAVWLAWVLAEQSGPAGVLALLAVAAALAFVLYVLRWGKVWAAIGAVALVMTVIVFWRPLVGAEAHASIAQEPWSTARVAELQAEGRPVFVNFTAAWCITCKLNENVAISRPRVRAALADANVAYLVGDWTNRDQDIAELLQAYGREGVPLYLYYPAGGEEPEVLPQLLSEDLLLNAIAGEAE